MKFLKEHCWSDKASFPLKLLSLFNATKRCVVFVGMCLDDLWVSLRFSALVAQALASQVTRVGFSSTLEVEETHEEIQRWQSFDMGVSKKGKTPKWMVYNNGKPYETWDDLGGKPTIFGNIHMRNLQLLMVQKSGKLTSWGWKLVVEIPWFTGFDIKHPRWLFGISEPSTVSRCSLCCLLVFPSNFIIDFSW